MKLVAVCHRCGAPKDLALARCAACGEVPTGGDREVALLCAEGLATPEELAEIQQRVRRGERLQPVAAARERARRALAGEADLPFEVTARELGLLVVGNLLLTPLLGYAWWFRSRTRPGRGARRVLFATLACSLVLTVALFLFRSG